MKQFHMPMPAKGVMFDLPDADLIALAVAINARTKVGRVSFFSQDERYSIIFQAGSRRAVVRLQGRPHDGDIEDIITALEAWAGAGSEDAQYSTELPPAPESGW
jgi:hypothetical protein